MILMLLACSGVEKSQTQYADKVLEGLIRVNAETTTDRIAILNGQILAHGEAALNSIGPSTEVIDLEGKVATPGFHDNHTHLLAGSFVLDKVLVNGSTSMGSIVNKTSNYAENNPNVSWIVGYGWLLSDMSDLPRGTDLDTASAERPIALFDGSGHNLLVNSKAMELAGISIDTPNPDGGEIIRDPDTNQPTGLLMEEAIGLISPMMTASFSDADLAANLVDGIERFQQAGITSIAEIMAVPGVDLGRPQIYSDLEDRGELNLRVGFYLPVFKQSDLSRVDEIQSRYDGKLLTFKGIKLWIDGSVSSGGSWSLAGHVDDADNFGSHYFESTDIELYIQTAESRGYDIKFHVNGDAAVQATLDAIESVLAQNGVLNQQYALEHAALIDPSDYDRIASLGLCASLQPGLALVGPLSGQAEAWGSERTNAAWNFPLIRDAGIPISLGTDWPVWPTPDAPVNLWSAAEGLGDRSIGLNDAFYAMTASGAQCMGQPGEFGCLEPGCAADITLLTDDPFAVSPAEISSIGVEELYVNGVNISP